MKLINVRDHIQGKCWRPGDSWSIDTVLKKLQLMVLLTPPGDRWKIDTLFGIGRGFGDLVWTGVQGRVIFRLLFSVGNVIDMFISRSKWQ